MSNRQKVLYSRHVTAITVSESLNAEPTSPPLAWTAEQVLSAYGDFLAGRLRMPQLKNPEPLFGGKTLATLCYCWLTVTREPSYDRYKDLLKRRYKTGELLASSEDQILDPFRQSLKSSLNRYPYQPEQMVSSPETFVSSEALIPASLAAEILGVTVASISNAATRGKIEGHERRGQRLFVPVAYLKGRFKRRVDPIN